MRTRFSLPALLTIIASAAAIAACGSSTVTSGPTPAKCELSFVAPTRIVAGGGSGTISITAQPECGWKVSTQANWISDVTPTSGQGNGTVAFSAAPNPMPLMRAADVMFNDERVQLSQDPAPCPITLSPATQKIGADGGSGQLEISTMAECSWTATSADAWLTITSGANGSGDGTITFKVESNGGDERNARVSVASQSATIVQSGARPTPASPAAPACSYSISAASESTGVNGGVIDVNVSATNGCSWKAVSNTSWILVRRGEIGTGNDTVRLNVAPNPGNARSGTVSIAGQTFTVRQATSCTFQVSTTSIQIPPSGNPRAVGVTAPPACTWSASSNTSWLTIVEGAESMGTAIARVSALPYTGPPRSGSVTVAGQTVTVTQ